MTTHDLQKIANDWELFFVPCSGRTFHNMFTFFNGELVKSDDTSFALVTHDFNVPIVLGYAVLEETGFTYIFDVILESFDDWGEITERTWNRLNFR